MLVEILAKALKSFWDEFREEIGLWMPVQIHNKEHDDKPEGEEEFGNFLFFNLSQNDHSCIEILLKVCIN